MSELLSADSGAVDARYQYDAYGNTVSALGPKADDNHYRFSTKEIDAAGLYYYGYRYYSPSLGRWVNRDPSGEAGGLNLYAFVANFPTGRIDPIGLEIESTPPGQVVAELRKMAAENGVTLDKLRTLLADYLPDEGTIFALLGTFVHKYVNDHYDDEHPQQAYFDDILLDIVFRNPKYGGPLKAAKLGIDSLLRPDILNHEKDLIYEVKSIRGWESGEAERSLKAYEGAFRKIGVTCIKRGGPTNGTNGTKVGATGIRVSWGLEEDGVIVYEFTRLPRSRLWLLVAGGQEDEELGPEAQKVAAVTAGSAAATAIVLKFLPLVLAL